MMLSDEWKRKKEQEDMRSLVLRLAMDAKKDEDGKALLGQPEPETKRWSWWEVLKDLW